MILTPEEKAAQGIFEKALVGAWRAYNIIEQQAISARQEAISEAYKEFIKAVGKKPEELYASNQD